MSGRKKIELSVMRAETVRDGKVLVVTIVDDRLDMTVACDFKRQMAEHISAGETEVVLNLSSVDFVDSTGLGTLVWLHKALPNSGELVITEAKKNVMTMFRLSRTDKLFRILPTNEEAISSFRYDDF